MPVLPLPSGRDHHRSATANAISFPLLPYSLHGSALVLCPRSPRTMRAGSTWVPVVKTASVAAAYDQVVTPGSDHPHPYPPPSRGRNLFGFKHISPSPGGRGEGEGEKSPPVRTIWTPMPISNLPSDRTRRNAKGLLGYNTMVTLASL
jgi:hypothetical protein